MGYIHVEAKILCARKEQVNHRVSQSVRRYETRVLGIMSKLLEFHDWTQKAISSHCRSWIDTLAGVMEACIQ
jgi:hypothetical protein